MSNEQWHTGHEMTLDVGLTDEEIRVNALHAAAACWAGISAITKRDEAILRTAELFEGWLHSAP